MSYQGAKPPTKKDPFVIIKDGEEAPGPATYDGLHNNPRVHKKTKKTHVGHPEDPRWDPSPIFWASRALLAGLRDHSGEPPAGYWTPKTTPK